MVLDFSWSLEPRWDLTQIINHMSLLSQLSAWHLMRRALLGTTVQKLYILQPRAACSGAPITQSKEPRS